MGSNHFEMLDSSHVYDMMHTHKKTIFQAGIFLLFSCLLPPLQNECAIIKNRSLEL